MDEAVSKLKRTDRMPVLFLGHGSPMNAIEDNEFTRSLAALAADVPVPDAVLVVSAHWLTSGPRVLAEPSPRTIHDFYGFPDELYAVEYPAPGAPRVAEAVTALCGAHPDTAWGLDHASWALLRVMYPDADVPVLELSLDPRMSPLEHVELAAKLAPLRERGVLILGSGNIVHNLRTISWETPHGAFDWAAEFDVWAARALESGDLGALAGYAQLGRIANLSVPTNEHYLPVLYAAALRTDDDPLEFTYEGIEYGSVSMRCVRIG